MKTFIVFLFAVLSSFSFAQKVEDFAYVRVPVKFSALEANQYQANHYVQYLLRQKNFKIISENKQIEELLNAPCEIIFVDLKDESSWFKTKIKIEFRDCRDQLVSSFDGKTNIKDLRKGYLDAIKNALEEVGNYNGKAYSAIQKKDSNLAQKVIKAEKLIPAQKIQPNSKEKRVNSSAKQEATAGDFTVYSDGFRDYRLEERDEIFLLKDMVNQSLFARLFPTQNSEIYQVKFYDGSSAVAYFFDGKIMFEKFNDAGEKQALELNKK